jgi:hypothetical protein
VPLRAGSSAVIAGRLSGRRRRGREMAPHQMAEQHGDPPPVRRRQARPSHDRPGRCRAHGVLPPNQPGQPTRLGLPAVPLSRGVALQTGLNKTMEQLFRSAKTLLRTRRIYHSSDAAIRGHVFCSFLALVLRKELEERCRAAGFRPEWGDVLRDLDRLQEIEISKDGRQMTLRTPATGVIGPLFKAARIALPANIRDAAA